MTTLTLLPAQKIDFNYNDSDNSLNIEDCGTFYLDRVYFISPIRKQMVHQINVEIYFYLNEVKISQRNGDEKEFVIQYNKLKRKL